MRVRWHVMAADDLEVDDRLPDAEKLALLVTRGVLPRRPQLEIFWNDPETGYVIAASDARDMRRGRAHGRRPKVYARLVWDREQPAEGLPPGGKARGASSGRCVCSDCHGRAQPGEPLCRACSDSGCEAEPGYICQKFKWRSGARGRVPDLADAVKKLTR